jgi:hypothetical protein
MYNDPVPKPSEGTSLFRGSPLSRNSRRLDNPDKIEPWRLFSYGWKWAIDVLLKEVKTGAHSSDHYYPILYVFRHYLEIKFKELIVNLEQEMHQQEKTFKNQDKNPHNIEALWNECKSLLIEFSKKNKSETDGSEPDYENLADFNLIGGFIKQISIIDPKSISFRYPIDMNGKMCIDGDRLGSIDMNYFSDNATWIIDYLERVSDWIDEIQHPSDDCYPSYGDDGYSD